MSLDHPKGIRLRTYKGRIRRGVDTSLEPEGGDYILDPTFHKEAQWLQPDIPPIEDFIKPTPITQQEWLALHNLNENHHS